MLINAHFEVVKSSLSPVASAPEVAESLVAGLSELKTSSIQIRLSKGLTALALFATGLARSAASDFKAAIAQFSEALRQEAVPDEVASDILTARGLAYLADQGFYSKNAFDDFNKAIRANAKNPFAHGNLIFIYLGRGKFDDAIAECKLLLEFDSDTEIQTMAYFVMGEAFFSKGDVAQGASSLDKMLQVSDADPTNAELFILRGMAYLFKKDFKSALENYDRGLHLTDKPRQLQS